MDFSGFTSWIVSQTSGLLTGFVAILVLLAFFRRDWKEVFIVGAVGGGAFFLITNASTFFGWIGNIFNMIS